MWDSEVYGAWFGGVGRSWALGVARGVGLSVEASGFCVRNPKP